jgi:hypothetical protein
VFDHAVDLITQATHDLLDQLQIRARPAAAS